MLSVTQVGRLRYGPGHCSGGPSRGTWCGGPRWSMLYWLRGLLATALAFTVQAWAQRYTTSTRTALIYTLEPVFAWLTSYWLVGEGLSKRAAAGAALILGGVVLVGMKPLSSRLHPSDSKVADRLRRYNESDCN